MYQPASSADRAYLAIKGLIRMEKVRQGEPLSERSIAEQLSLSRTPVREAMRALAREGLLEIIPMRGTFVRRPSIGDLREIHEARHALERMAVGLAAQRGAPPRLDRCAEVLRDLLAREPIDVIAAQSAGWNFHDALFEAAGNGRLAAIYAGLREESGLAMRQIADYDSARTRSAVTEHLAIYAAIAAGDADRAKELMEDHLNAALRHKIETMATRA